MKTKLSNHKSLLSYKKSLNDWHYNPMIKSTDYLYVGRIKNNFTDILKTITWPEEKSNIEIWEDDLKKPMNIHNLAWGKLDHHKAGYTKHNTKHQNNINFW